MVSGVLTTHQRPLTTHQKDVGYVVTAAWQIVSLPVRVQVPLANLTLEPDGQATGCNPVEVGSIPTGVFLKKALAEHAESAEKKL